MALAPQPICYTNICRVSTTSEARAKYFPLQPSLLKPGMGSPMKVQGQFQMFSQSQVSTDDLLVLHFILQSIDGIGSPAHLLYQYMQGFNNIRSWWKIFPPAAFSPETWNGESHESTRAISNVLSIPSQHR